MGVVRLQQNTRVTQRGRALVCLNSHHFPAFCIPLLIVNDKLWGRFPLGSFLVGKKYLVITVFDLLSVSAFTGLPAGTFPFPLETPLFLLPAAVAWIDDSHVQPQCFVYQSHAMLRLGVHRISCWTG